MGAAQLLERGGLARGPGARHDQAAAGADLAAVHQRQQPTLPGNLPQLGGGDDDELGVVADTGLLVRVPALQRQSIPRNDANDLTGAARSNGAAHTSLSGPWQS